MHVCTVVFEGLLPQHTHDLTCESGIQNPVRYELAVTTVCWDSDTRHNTSVLRSRSTLSGVMTEHLTAHTA